MSKQSTSLADPLNPLTPEFLQNPYPTFKRLREEAPVFWSVKNHYWIMTRYEDIHGILRELSFEKRLQRWNQVNPLVKMMPQVSKLMKTRESWMLNMDQPDHTRMRGLVNRAFTPKMVGGMRDHIQDIANFLVERLDGKKGFDVVPEYSFPLPVTVIAEMLGVPREDRDKFKKWSNALTSTLEPGFNMDHMSKANTANDELFAYLKVIVDQRRQEPKEDLISALVVAEDEGNKLTEHELISNCILLLVAGHETTVNLIANSIRTLLQHPDQLEILKSKPELIQSAINEVLRFESPVQNVRRLAAEDMEVGGTKIKAGDMCVLMLGAANRDPEAFEDPDRFDITRDFSAKKHLSYGHGIHHCLGSSLADTEGQVAVSTFFNHFPDIKLKTQDIQIRMPFALRGPKELWVENP